MQLLKELALLVVCISYFCHNTEGRYANGQCGAAFVKALYEACAISKRAFQPLVIPEEHLEEYQGLEERSNGGRFGGFGGGGSFKRVFRLQEDDPFVQRRVDAVREETDGRPSSSQNYPEVSPDIEDSVMAYLKHLGKAEEQEKADPGFENSAIDYMMDLTQRGSTATNLLADYCCKHGCKWETFVGLCK